MKKRVTVKTHSATVRRSHGWAGSSCNGDATVWFDDENPDRAEGKWRLGSFVPIDRLAGEPLPDGTRVMITIRSIIDTEATFKPNHWHIRDKRDCVCNERAKDEALRTRKEVQRRVSPDAVNLLGEIAKDGFDES